MYKLIKMKIILTIMNRKIYILIKIKVLKENNKRKKTKMFP